MDEKRNYIVTNGDIITDLKSKIRYRIYMVDDSTAYAVQLDCTSLELMKMGVYDIAGKIRSGKFSVEQDDQVIIDETMLSDAALEEYTRRAELIMDIAGIVDSTWENVKTPSVRAAINEAAKIHGYGKTSVWKWIRRFLQAGCAYSGLLDKRLTRFEREPMEYRKKAGRPPFRGNTNKGIPLTDEVREHFEKARTKCLKSKNKEMTTAYQEMLDKHYSVRDGNSIQWLDESERPTLNQFIHYCRTMTTQKEINKKKLGAREERNSKRLLLGSTRNGIIRPGQLIEIDALESDIGLVSELSPNQAIGRPDVYAMVDIYSGAILAITSGFNDNSYLGLSSVFMNLIDDKHAFCNKYGIDFDGDLWPSCIIPEAGRYDNGSDFTSENFREMCRRMKIRTENVPPGTGSMKGTIEGIFHQFQSTFRPYAENKGLIEKDKYGNPHKKACLNNRDFTRMLISFVLFYNARIISSYRCSKEILERGIQPSPANLWKYGIEVSGSPRIINNSMRAQLYYDTMLVAKGATISRRGVFFNGLVYVHDELKVKMYEAGDQKIPFKARFDPRDVGSLYFLVNGEIRRATLNEGIIGNAEFGDMTHAQYELYHDALLEQRERAKVANLETNAARNRIIADMMKGPKDSTQPNVENMREAREEEKQADNYDDRISARNAFEFTEQDKPESENIIDNSDDYIPYTDEELFDIL